MLNLTYPNPAPLESLAVLFYDDDGLADLNGQAGTGPANGDPYPHAVGLYARGPDGLACHLHDVTPAHWAAAVRIGLHGAAVQPGRTLARVAIVGGYRVTLNGRTIESECRTQDDAHTLAGYVVYALGVVGVSSETRFIA